MCFTLSFLYVCLNIMSKFKFVFLQECVVKTTKGSVSVFVCGDQEKPPLVTYPDIALNCTFHFFLSFFSFSFNGVS